MIKAKKHSKKILSKSVEEKHIEEENYIENATILSKTPDSDHPYNEPEELPDNEQKQIEGDENFSGA